MARKLMQGDVEELLRTASRVAPASILENDPRLRAYARQLATMVLTRSLADFTDAEVNAEFKRRNQPPPNPQAPTMKGKT